MLKRIQCSNTGILWLAGKCGKCCGRKVEGKLLSTYVARCFDCTRKREVFNVVIILIGDGQVAVMSYTSNWLSV